MRWWSGGNGKNLFCPSKSRESPASTPTFQRHFPEMSRALLSIFSCLYWMVAIYVQIKSSHVRCTHQFLHLQHRRPTWWHTVTRSWEQPRQTWREGFLLKQSDPRRSFVTYKPFQFWPTWKKMLNEKVELTCVGPPLIIHSPHLHWNTQKKFKSRRYPISLCSLIQNHTWNSLVVWTAWICGQKRLVHLCFDH